MLRYANVRLGKLELEEMKPENREFSLEKELNDFIEAEKEEQFYGVESVDEDEKDVNLDLDLTREDLYNFVDQDVMFRRILSKQM